MCLSVPAKVISLKDQSAEVEMSRSRFTVSTALVEDLSVGDYVLIHTGFAIEKISPDQADEMVKLLREIIGSA